MIEICLPGIGAEGSSAVICIWVTRWNSFCHSCKGAWFSVFHKDTCRHIIELLHELDYESGKKVYRLATSFDHIFVVVITYLPYFVTKVGLAAMFYSVVDKNVFSDVRLYNFYLVQLLC